MQLDKVLYGQVRFLSMQVFQIKLLREFVFNILITNKRRDMIKGRSW